MEAEAGGLPQIWDQTCLSWERKKKTTNKPQISLSENNKAITFHDAWLATCKATHLTSNCFSVSLIIWFPCPQTSLNLSRRDKWGLGLLTSHVCLLLKKAFFAKLVPLGIRRLWSKLHLSGWHNGQGLLKTLWCLSLSLMETEFHHWATSFGNIQEDKARMCKQHQQL